MDHTYCIAAIVVLVLIVIFVAYKWGKCYGKHSTVTGYCSGEGPRESLAVSDLARWMSQLDPNTPYNQITMLGVHDALTYGNACVACSDCSNIGITSGYVQCAPICEGASVVNGMVQTQNTTVLRGLQLGVRYFDLRFTWNGGRPAGRHASFTCTHYKGNYIDDVVNDLSSFLGSIGSEVIILHISIDGSDSPDQCTDKVYGWLQGSFGSKIVPTSTDLTSSFGNVQGKGNLVIVSSTADGGYNQLRSFGGIVFPSSTVFNPWSPDVYHGSAGKNMTKYLQQIYSSQTPSAPLTVCQAIIPYATSDAPYSIWSSAGNTNAQITSGLSNSPSAAIPPPQGRAKHGVILLDFPQQGNMWGVIPALN